MFGQRLVDKGVIDQKQLDEAIHKQQTAMTHRRLGEVLVRLGYISKSHITDILSEQHGVPIVKIAEREVPERVIRQVDTNVAQIYRCVPVGEENGTLQVAIANPTDINLIDNLERLLERPIEPVLSSPEDIQAALRKYYDLSEQTVESMLSSVSSASSMSTLSTMSNVGSLGAEASSLESMSASEINAESISVDSVDIEGDFGPEETEEEAEDSAVVRYVHHLISEAFRLRASDIHVEPGKTDLKVRYRIDGVLHLQEPPPKRAQPSIISRLKILSGMDIAERRKNQDGRIKLALAGKPLDLRVSSMPSVHGETIVMRILDKSGLMLGLGQLGFDAEDQQRWEHLLSTSTGVVLVTGPTGSGKTTTLYASLHRLNQPERKLITVEDPVEYQLSGVNQVHINHEIGLTFARALRAIFRQDPDIVMVGEIRDAETAEIAIRAALTGHLVFSTLHTNDAASAFIRLVDIGVKPFLVSSGVRAILAQRLVRVICENCKEAYKPDDEELERFGIDVDPSKQEFFRGQGCEICGETGFQGRLGVFELLMADDTIQRLIMDGASSRELRRRARLGGMKTMREDAVQKVLSGTTTIEEINRVTAIDEPLYDDNGVVVR
jgi:type II secretory ATPase GspE/PulE/Tfp pilus assembly ATPase PilB-like protein